MFNDALAIVVWGLPVSVDSGQVPVPFGNDRIRGSVSRCYGTKFAFGQFLGRVFLCAVAVELVKGPGP